jgi:hypothetical protein
MRRTPKFWLTHLIIAGNKFYHTIQYSLSCELCGRLRLWKAQRALLLFRLLLLHHLGHTTEVYLDTWCRCITPALVLFKVVAGNVATTC